MTSFAFAKEVDVSQKNSTINKWGETGKISQGHPQNNKQKIENRNNIASKGKV